MHGMPPHIAQLVAGHRDIGVTLGYKAVYPEEVINAHRAFITRRRALRPAEEYRTPTEEEWAEFLGHFERRKLSLGTCGRSYATPCIHEHACIRCPLLRPDPAQRPRLAEIRDNLIARIGEAQREGWTGEAEGLKVSLAAADQKLAQMDQIAARRRATVIHLGMPGHPPPSAAPSPRRPPLPGQPDDHPDLPAALRACASGFYPAEASAELLISHGSFLDRSDFTGRFIRNRHQHHRRHHHDGQHRLARRDHRPGHR